MTHTPAQDEWWKSSYSNGAGGNCVEMATATDDTTVLIRDSKDLDGRRISFDRRSWCEFIASMPLNVADQPR
jgi:hypothetical protein